MNRLVRNTVQLAVSSVRAARAAPYKRPASSYYCPTRFASSDTDFKPSEELAKERYDLRANEDIEKKRARLLYQSRKRGMLENGVILASFANKYLATFDSDHLDQYDRLINLPTNDWDIYYWATKTKPTPPEFETPVLAMLREHLTSKVSNDETRKGALRDSVLGKTRLDDVVMPAVKQWYDLEIEPAEVDLVNYKQDLFDNRERSYGSKYIQLMTAWRKRTLERRLKRIISSPTSLRSLSRNEEKVFTQKIDKRDVACDTVEPKVMIDSQYDRAMKHHNFLQHLLNSELTDEPRDYDEEAEAWADMLWHRNYGINEDKVAPSRDHKCAKCRSRLHCCDSGLRGYVPKEVFVSIGSNAVISPETLMCQACKFSTTYGAKLSHEISRDNYELVLQNLATEKPALIVVLVDLTDFPSSIWKGLVDLIGSENKLYLVVGNKLDLLPYDGPKMLERVNYAFRKNLDRLRPDNRNLRITDSMVLSARTGFGIQGLVTRILAQMDENLRDVYLVGSNNSGKSTLFSALLQSDLCAKRTGDIISRVSAYDIPGSDLRMLRFPIDLADGWQVEMMKRKCIRAERNSAAQIHALGATSECRQKLMPHISTLINRLEFSPCTNSSELSRTTSTSPDISNPERPRFSEDHPLVNVHDGEPMSASKDTFKQNTFLHHTPSSCHPDQLHDLLTVDERLEVFPNETIIPRKYTLRPLQSIFIAGLARLDLLTSTSTVIFTIFASKYLPVHVIQTRKADKFYHQFLGSPYLGVPFGNEARLSAWPDLQSTDADFHIQSAKSNFGSADIVLSSAGWAMISLGIDQECIVRAHTPESRGIFLRNPPLLVKASSHSTGRKIRDTPMFVNPNYRIESSTL